MANLTARPTVYKGIKMRSRLEARFAWWLDSVVELPHWDYEPQAYAGTQGQYLPDFVYAIGNHTIYAEVKPLTADADEALDRMHVILESDPTAILHVAVDHSDYPDHPHFYPSAAYCAPDHGCGRCDRRPSVMDLFS